MAPPAPILRCWDLTDAHIRDAIVSRKGMGDLIHKMAEVSRPGDGAPKILLAIARLAEPTCEWLEGFLRVEIDSRDPGMTQIRITEDMGGGIRELVYGRIIVHAPLDEFERSVRLAPQAIEPLIQQKDTDKIVLIQPGRGRAKSRPAFELAEDCLRDSLPPDVRETVSPTITADHVIKPIEPKPTPAAPAAATFPQEPPTVKRKVVIRRAEPPKHLREGAPIMDIPRAPKFLDFGDLAPKKPSAAPAKPAGPKPEQATKPAPPKPPPLPPGAKQKKPSRIPPKRPSRVPTANKK